MRAINRGMVLVVAGMLVALGLGEGVLRLSEPIIPPPSVWPTPETQIKQGQLSHLDSIDVVFLGSSITEAAVDPVALSEESGSGLVYNAALPFSTPFSNEVWLDDVVLRSSKPSLVVIGLPAWSSVDRPGSDPLLSGIESALAYEGGHRWADGSALLRNSGVASEWDQRRAQEHLADSGTLTGLGQQTGYYDRKLDEAGSLELPAVEAQLSDGESAAIGRIIGRLKSLGIESVVMIEPGRYPGTNTVVDEDRFIESVDRHAADWGVPIWDTYHMQWDDSWFADRAHFNRIGTAVFTSRLAPMVQALTTG